jgi:hypothetical protein
MVEKADYSARAVEGSVGWNWLFCLSAIFLQRIIHGFTWIGKMTKAWNSCDPRKGGFVASPGVMKVESCTKPQHFRRVFERPDTASPWREECKAGTGYWTGESDYRGYRGEAIYDTKHSRRDAVGG